MAGRWEPALGTAGSWGRGSREQGSEATPQFVSFPAKVSSEVEGKKLFQHCPCIGMGL